MKTIFKALIISSLLLSTACIEMFVGTAAVATGSFIAKQGYLAEYVDRSYDSCWQNMEKFVQSIEDAKPENATEGAQPTEGEEAKEVEKSKITYLSQNEGIIKIDFAGGGHGTFKIEKTTERATQISIKCYKYGFPSNTLADYYFPAFHNSLK